MAWADLQAAYDGLSEPVALRLTGVTEAKGQALLPFPQAHASSPNYPVSFGWKPGDVVLWDNLATWHYAVNDYDGPRVYRKVIAG
jgi:taurine dioxygenase